MYESARRLLPGFFLLPCVAFATLGASLPAAQPEAADLLTPRVLPTNNWAVLVCTSRFWFNYRHA